MEDLVSIDLESYPIPVMTIVGDMTEEDYGQFIRANDAAFEKSRETRKPFVLVVDASRAGPWNAAVRKRHNAYLKLSVDRVNPLNLGTHLVVSNPLHRALLAATRWLVPQLADIYTYADLSTAIVEAQKRLENSKYRS